MTKEKRKMSRTREHTYMAFGVSTFIAVMFYYVGGLWGAGVGEFVLWLFTALVLKVILGVGTATENWVRRNANDRNS